MLSKRTPTQRTMEALREVGWTVGVVERYMSRVGMFGIRRDYLGIIDVIGCHPNLGILGVQCCAASGKASHVRKIISSSNSLEWIDAGGRLEVWSWRKYVKPVDRKYWRSTITRIAASDILTAALEA